MSATNPKLFNVGELSIGAEAEYGETSGSLEHVRCVSCDVSGLEAVSIEDNHMKQGDYQVARIVGPKQGAITTVHHIGGWTTNTDPGAPALADPPGDGVQMLMSVLGSAMGGIIAGGKATDIATGGGSGPTGNTMSGTVNSFTIGQAVAYNSSVGHQMSWITNESGGVLTTLQSRDSDQHNSDADLHGSFTAYKTTGAAYHDIVSNVEGYTLQLLGHETDDKIVAVGCLPTGLTMSFPIGELPTMTVTWGVGGWTESGSGGLGGGVAPTAWAGALPQAVMNGTVTRGASMGSANDLRIGSLEIDLQIERPVILDPSFENGIGGFGPLRTIPKLSFSVFRSHAEDVTRFLDQDSDIYTFTFGTAPGSMIGICVPAGRLTAYPTKGESDGAVVSELELYCNSYTGDTGATPATQNTPVDSDFRIAFA